MQTRDELYWQGANLMKGWCRLNNIEEPLLIRLKPTDRLYHLATCAFYRPRCITIMVEKCARQGMGGRAWSWPAYVIDRTPFGVVQHELGHHVDEVKSTRPLKVKEDMFSYRVYQESKEEPLTGYLGTDREAQTFFKEWFAEIFRLYVTNPNLCKKLRPKFSATMVKERLHPMNDDGWRIRLREDFHAPSRIIDQAQKKIDHASS